MGVKHKKELIPDKLGKEGIKLLVKGKLKHIPNISIRQPNKKPRDNSKKKENLEAIAREIEENIKKFEGKKDIVERVLGGGGGGAGGSAGNVSVNVPVHIPEFSVPENPTRNNLNDINNTVLEAENELREYFEEQTNLPFLQIEEIYEEIGNGDVAEVDIGEAAEILQEEQEEQEDNIIQPRIIPNILPIEPQIQQLPQPEILPEDIDEADILPEDSDEADRMIQAETQPVYDYTPQPVNEDINRIREIFRDIKDRPSGVPIIEEPDDEPQNLSPFGRQLPPLEIEAPPSQPLLAIEGPQQSQPLLKIGDIQVVPPRNTPVQQTIDDWVEIDEYENLPSIAFRPPPSRSFMDNISDVVDIAESSVVNFFGEAKPRKLELNQSKTDFQEYDRTEDDIKTRNNEQDELELKSKELKEKQKMIDDMEVANKLNQDDINRLENELGEKMVDIDSMRDSKLKDDKIKEAQILKNQLDRYDKQEELQDDINELKKKLQNKPLNLSSLPDGVAEMVDNATRFQLSSEEQASLEEKRIKGAKKEELEDKFKQMGIRHNKGGYNNLVKLDNIRDRLGDETFMNVAENIYKETGKNAKTMDFLYRMENYIKEAKNPSTTASTTEPLSNELSRFGFSQKFIEAEPQPQQLLSQPPISQPGLDVKFKEKVLSAEELLEPYQSSLSRNTSIDSRTEEQEEALQRQIIDEIAAENEDDEDDEDIEDDPVKMLENMKTVIEYLDKTIDIEQRDIDNKENELDTIIADLNELVDEYKNLTQTLNQEFKFAGVNSIDDIMKIEDVKTRENIKKAYDYLEPEITQMDKDMDRMVEIIENKKKEIIELEEKLNTNKEDRKEYDGAVKQYESAFRLD